MKKIVIHLFTLFITTGALAQQRAITGFLLGGAAIPNKSFQRVYDNKMGGLGLGWNLGFVVNPLALGHNKTWSPIWLGIDLGWNYLGRDKYTYNNEPYLKTEFWSGNYGLLVRIDPTEKSYRQRRFRPFADGFAGWGRYWANTKYDKTFAQSLIDDNQYLAGKYHDDNFTTGLGCGFIWAGKDRYEPSFTFRAMYYLNGEYKAVLRNSIAVSGNYLMYQVQRVNANMLVLQCGISFGD
jgi:hypothetical protein